MKWIRPASQILPMIVVSEFEHPTLRIPCVTAVTRDCKRRLVARVEDVVELTATGTGPGLFPGKCLADWIEFASVVGRA